MTAEKRGAAASDEKNVEPSVESALAGASAAEQKTLRDLGWDTLVRAVGARCRGPLAHRPRLPIARTREGARLAHAETTEVLNLLRAGESLPLDGIFDLRASLKRAERGGVLDGPSLRDVMKTLRAARGLRRYLSSRRELLEALSRACPLDPTLDDLEEDLSYAIDEDGTLSDNASPELRRLRTEVANLRQRLVRRLEELLVKHSNIVQDRFHTLREGRYVVPIRRDAHEKLPGIVHGTSASGATVFVEPRALVEQGNRLKIAQGELEREELRILTELSELIAEHVAPIRAACDALDHADLRQAGARLGFDLDAEPLDFADEPVIELGAARHPILLLESVDVVPSDLELKAGGALVLSGPNAGGKTVALKNFGLAALMIRAGLPFPAKEGSKVGFFEPVLSDVGDEQSLQKNLSTFSAHITNITRILDESREGALVLLDELASGTDPGEGAALAVALAEAFVRRGAAVALTTHYEPLKALGTRDERFTNAAVGFDVARMRPTFLLHWGIPGASSALAVAQRFGIPEHIVEAARGVLPDQTRNFDELVQTLHTHQRALVDAEAEIAQERRGLRDERQKLADTRQKLEARGQKAINEEAERVRKELRDLRRSLKETRKGIREAKHERDLEETRKRLDDATRTVDERAPRISEEDVAPALTELPAAGDEVFLAQLGRSAKVVEVDDGKSRVRVAAGAMKLWVDLADLRAAPETSAGKASKSKGGAKPKSAPPFRKPKSWDKPAEESKPVSTPDNTLDLRGMRVDDALAMTESFLDRLYGASARAAFIVHGVGTGALREAVRELLRDRGDYVHSYRSGTTEEGGDRLTVVTLA